MITENEQKRFDQLSAIIKEKNYYALSEDEKAEFQTLKEKLKAPASPTQEPAPSEEKKAGKGEKTSRSVERPEDSEDPDIKSGVVVFDKEKKCYMRCFKTVNGQKVPITPTPVTLSAEEKKEDKRKFKTVNGQQIPINAPQTHKPEVNPKPKRDPKKKYDQYGFEIKEPPIDALVPKP